MLYMYMYSRQLEAQMDHPQEVSWLRKRFQEVSSDSPALKRVKFSSIHELLAAEFPSTRFSPKVVSDIVHEEQQCDDLECEKPLNAKLIERIRVLEAHTQELERVHQLEQQQSI